MAQKDFNLKITVRNARLLKAVEEAFGSAAELGRVAGVGNSQLSALMTMRASPFQKNGGLTKPAEAIVSALGIPADELWPDHIARLKAKKATVEVEMDAPTFAAIAQNDFEKTAIYREAIARWSSDLTDRECQILADRTGGATYDDLAKEQGVTRERIRQIEIKAMRKCRKRARYDSVENFSEITQ